MRVLIFGGRDWDDQDALNRLLDEAHAALRFTVVINGGQATRDKEQRNRLYGADWQAAVWASRSGLPVRYFYADWNLGKAGGPIRNQRMVDVGRPEVGIEFRGGNGTQNMRGKLRKAGIPVEPLWSMTETERATFYQNVRCRG